MVHAHDPAVERANGINERARGPWLGCGALTCMLSVLSFGFLLCLATQNLSQITEKPGTPMYWGLVITLGNWKGWASKAEDPRQLDMPPMHD